MMNLDWKGASKTIINNIVLRRLKEYEGVIIFGAGDSGSWAYRLLKEDGLVVKAFCDNNKHLWGERKYEICIESFEIAIQKYPEAAICIASMWSEEILAQIKDYNPVLISKTFNILTTMAWETSNKCYESTEIEYIKKNLKGFEQLYMQLADDVSRVTLEGILNYRLTRNSRYLADIKSKEVVYLDRSVIKEHLFESISMGTIIDGGAFDGDTIEQFIRFLGRNDRALHIHCYEANAENVVKLRQKIELFASNRIEVHESALWNSSGEKLCFMGDNLSGKLTEGIPKQLDKDQTDVELSADVVTERIDDTLYENLTFIKLDIEGAERFALEGAQETIKRSKPILAICAYHLQDDLLVLADTIRSMLPNYKLYLRHYMLSAGDTMLYGIPN